MLRFDVCGHRATLTPLWRHTHVSSDADIRLFGACRRRDFLESTAAPLRQRRATSPPANVNPPTRFRRSSCRTAGSIPTPHSPAARAAAIARSSEVTVCRSSSIKRTFGFDSLTQAVSRRCAGELPQTARVNYIPGNDASKWSPPRTCGPALTYASSPYAVWIFVVRSGGLRSPLKRPC